jgi:hypothetical protein
MSSTTSAEREAFEKWATETWLDGINLAWTDARNCYDDFTTHVSFQSYREGARAALSSPALPDQESHSLLRDDVLGILIRWGRDDDYDIDTCIGDLRRALTDSPPSAPPGSAD